MSARTARCSASSSPRTRSSSLRTSLSMGAPFVGSGGGQRPPFSDGRGRPPLVSTHASKAPRTVCAEGVVFARVLAGLFLFPSRGVCHAVNGRFF